MPIRSIPGVTVHRSEDGYVADVWHSDGQPRPAPVKYTIFKMITAPSRGGDTIWINQYLVYEQLSPPHARPARRPHRAATIARQPDRAVDRIPQCSSIPVTGRKLLYVSKAHTVRFLELSLGESRALIDYLVDVATQPEYVCRYRWSPGAVGIWDNLATVHYGVNDFDEPRVFHRVMVQGPVLADRVGRWPTSTTSVRARWCAKTARPASSVR